MYVAVEMMDVDDGKEETPPPSLAIYSSYCFVDGVLHYVPVFRALDSSSLTLISLRPGMDSKEQEITSLNHTNLCLVFT